MTWLPRHVALTHCFVCVAYTVPKKLYDTPNLLRAQIASRKLYADLTHLPVTCSCRMHPVEVLHDMLEGTSTRLPWHLGQTLGVLSCTISLITPEAAVLLPSHCIGGHQHSGIRQADTGPSIAREFRPVGGLSGYKVAPTAGA